MKSAFCLVLLEARQAWKNHELGETDAGMQVVAPLEKSG